MSQPTVIVNPRQSITEPGGKMLDLDKIKPVDIVPIPDSDDQMECNKLYYSKMAHRFFYKYKYGGLTFNIKLILADGEQGEYEVVRTTDEYGFSFVEDSGSNLSGQNLKLVIASVNEYFKDQDADHQIRKLLFCRVDDSFTQKFIESIRSFLLSQVTKLTDGWGEDLTEDKILKMDKFELIRVFKRFSLSGKIHNPEIASELERLDNLSSEEKEKVRLKRARGLNMGLANVFKNEIKTGHVKFEYIGSALVIHFHKIELI
jgi:uncharacterized protein YnzC (UPF0291/DUF896 family)